MSEDSSESQPRQEINSGRDSFVAGRDLNYFAPASEPTPTLPVIVGDVPQEPAAFQLRAGPMEALLHPPGDRVRVVFAVTGIRGVGKTQVAAAYSRRRITEGWQLVAWVDAGDQAAVLAGLADVAVAAGIGSAQEDAQLLAAKVRHWLEADGEQRLLVLDDADDLNMLRPFLPAAGAAQVVVTSSRRSAGDLGAAVPVDVFTEEEALAFLAERTGLEDEASARELAGEMGFLPLGLAQAAALIAREHLSYGTYLKRLRSLPIVDYLRQAKADPYPYRLAEAIILSLRAVEVHDRSGRRARLMWLVAVLSETGVSRRVLYLAARDRTFGRGQSGPTEVDAALGELADASLLGFTVDGESVVVHRLVMRVTREWLLVSKRRPSKVPFNASVALTFLAGEIDEPWRDPAGVRELAAHVSAVTACFASDPNGKSGKVYIRMLLPLRLTSVSLLNGLGDGTGFAISTAEQLVNDCERLVGVNHLSTLVARNHLAEAYHNAGRAAGLVSRLEQTLTDGERLLGIDHPVTLVSRTNLALAYQDAGRTNEAISLLERTLTDSERLLGTSHPDILTIRNNLAQAYVDAGRTAEAIPLLRQTIAEGEQLLQAADSLGPLSALDRRAADDAKYRTAEQYILAAALIGNALTGIERQGNDE